METTEQAVLATRGRYVVTYGVVPDHLLAADNAGRGLKGYLITNTEHATVEAWDASYPRALYMAMQLDMLWDEMLDEEVYYEDDDTPDPEVDGFIVN